MSPLCAVVDYACRGWEHDYMRVERTPPVVRQGPTRTPSDPSPPHSSAVDVETDVTPAQLRMAVARRRDCWGSRPHGTRLSRLALALDGVGFAPRPSGIERCAGLAALGAHRAMQPPFGDLLPTHHVLGVAGGASPLLSFLRVAAELCDKKL